MMPEVRLIDANALNEKLKYAFPTEYGKSVYVQGIIDSMPTIEAEPVRQGRWLVRVLNIGGGDKIRMLQCSECSRNANMKFDFCPNCGARMDEDDYAE